MQHVQVDSIAVSLSTNSETAMLSMCRWRWRRCRLWFWRQCGVLCLVKCAVKPQTRLRQRTPPTAVRLQITESQNCQVTASHDTNLVASPVFSNQSYKTLCPFLSNATTPQLQSLFVNVVWFTKHNLPLFLDLNIPEMLWKLVVVGDANEDVNFLVRCRQNMSGLGSSVIARGQTPPSDQLTKQPIIIILSSSGST